MGQLKPIRRRRPVHITVGPNCLVTRPSSDRTAVGNAVVSQALQFVRERAFDYLIGVPDVVRHVGVSRSTLEIRFKRHLNCTIHEEILRIRLSMARRLLTSSGLSLQVIAERSGFSSPHYMSAVFQRELGYPPGRLRKQAGSI